MGDFLKKLQQQPQHQKRNIILAVIIILVLVLGWLWTKNLKYHWRELKARKFKLELPSIQEQLEL